MNALSERCAWDIRLDESIFLGGLPKVEFLKAYDADVFDDQQTHCELAADHIATGHVPHGSQTRSNQSVHLLEPKYLRRQFLIP